MQADDVFSRQIDCVVERFGSNWQYLRQARLFVTGGTGYFGRWLLPILAQANAIHNLSLTVTVLSRNPQHALATMRELTNPGCIRCHAGDVRDFDFPAEDFTHLIHGAATAAMATFRDQEDALTKFDTTLQGMRRVLDLAVARGRPRMLVLGSGSCYGPLPEDADAYTEDCAVAPTLTRLDLAMGHAKRAAEFLCNCYADRYGLSISTARCFTFLGPHLPLELHYAAGNFIRDALWADHITVSGDGSPVRSYLYTGDLMVWLLTLLVHGQAGRAYNVGSNRPINIGDLARMIGTLLAPGKEVRIQGAGATRTLRNIYLPNIDRARTELGLDVWTTLPEAIRHTATHALLHSTYLTEGDR